jgi:prepilin-type N-terminal cleavage/methylation domain-containing protein
MRDVATCFDDNDLRHSRLWHRSCLVCAPASTTDLTMTRRKGFTFVELLVVMLFIGALSSMAVPRFREYKTRAFVAAMESDLGNLRIAQEAHWAENRRTVNVSLQITSQDVLGGYTAVATHANVPGRQCLTAMGAEAAPREPGSISCVSIVSGGSSTIPSSP